MKFAKTPSIQTLVQQRREVKPLTATNTPAARANSAVLAAAEARTRQVIEFAKTQRFTSWDDMEKRFNLTVPGHIRSQPYSYLECLRWANWFKTKALEPEPEVIAPKLRIPNVAELGEVVCGAYRLRPRQRKARWQILSELFETQHSAAVMIPMNTGSGKTAVASGVIDDILKQAYHGLGNRIKMWNIIMVVPKGTKIKASRFLARAGIRDIGTDVLMLAYSELRSKRYKAVFEEYEVVNPYNGEKVKRIRFMMGKPVLVIFDECHKLKNQNSQTAKYAQALIEAAQRLMFMSATPAIVPQDLKQFVLATKMKWNGSVIDEINYRAFLHSVGKSHPDEQNESAVKRIFDWFGSAIVNPPSDPRTVKAYNGVKLINFENEASKIRYHKAQDNYLELARKFGNEPSEMGQILVAFTNFRRAAELEAVNQVVDLMEEEHKKGRAPIMAVCYKQTLKSAVARLASKYGVPRSKISIIWGGESEIREFAVVEVTTKVGTYRGNLLKETVDWVELEIKGAPYKFSRVDILNFKVVTKSDIMPLFEWIKLRMQAETEGYVWTDKKLRTIYNKSTKYHNTRLKAERSVEDQRELDRWTSQMRLHDQTPEQRQDEIDNFLNGQTEYCLFTLAAGGTGIDLDHQVEGVRPRTMFCMTCYYAEEFAQAFGRAYREFTLSDVYQYVILFAGTIIANHVAPKLGVKLKSIAKSTGAGLNIEAELTRAAMSNRLPTEPVLIDTNPVEVDDIIIDNDDDDDDDNNGN